MESAVQRGRSAGEQAEGDRVRLTFDLPRSLPPLIGLGAFLKDTITVIDVNWAYVSRDVGHIRIRLRPSGTWKKRPGP